MGTSLCSWPGAHPGHPGGCISNLKAWKAGMEIKEYQVYGHQCWPWCPKKPGNNPVLPAARLSATTPSSTHVATCGSTRSVVVSLVDWWHTRTSAPGVMASLRLWTADQWLKWMLKAPSLIWRLLSAVWVTCCVPVALWPCHCRQMLCGLRKVQEIIACPHLQLGYAPWLRNMGIEHIRPRAATLQWLCHDPMDLCHQRPWWNTLSFTTQEPWH